MRKEWILGSNNNGLCHQNEGIFLENKMEVNKRPLGTTGEGEGKKGQGKFKLKCYHKYIIYGELHSSFCRKDNMTSTVPKKSRIGEGKEPGFNNSESSC